MLNKFIFFSGASAFAQVLCPPELPCFLSLSSPSPTVCAGDQDSLTLKVTDRPSGSFLFILFYRGSVFDKIEEEEEEDEEGEEDADGDSFKTDIEVDDRTYSVGNESSLNEGLRSRVRDPPNSFQC